MIRIQEFFESKTSTIPGTRKVALEQDVRIFGVDEDTGKLYFNEINTIPGSLAFYLWEPVGIPYKELLDRMIQLALKRVRIEESLTFTFDTNILNNAGFGGAKGSKV
jgi:D-alanine-D-alanine ligase